MGLTFVLPVTLIATSGVPGSDAGLASGLYNVAADRRRTGPRDPLHVRGERDRRHASPPWAEPTREDQAQALVDGFHVAYLGSALLIAVAAVFLFLLLRLEDVAVIGEGEAALAQA